MAKKLWIAKAIQKPGIDPAIQANTALFEHAGSITLKHRQNDVGRQPQAMKASAGRRVLRT